MAMMTLKLWLTDSTAKELLSQSQGDFVSLWINGKETFECSSKVLADLLLTSERVRFEVSLCEDTEEEDLED